MVCSEDTQSVKCSAGEHLGFFWSDTNVIYGLIPPPFPPTKHRLYYDGSGEVGF